MALRDEARGIHHITAITGDAVGNVEFYAGVLGLRMIKKTVNQDDPTVYHLFYGDEHGSPGMDLPFFEYPGAAPGGPAREWCIGSSGACHRMRTLSFWKERLGAHGVEGTLTEDSLLFADPEASSTSCCPRAATSRC